MEKLMICKACQKEISKQAKSCPYCGEPSPSSKMMRASLGLMGFGFLMIVGVPILIVIVAVISTLLQ